LEKSGIEEESVDYSDFDKVADRFDVADSFINLHGHIIGMTVSPDHRYLYVNCRPWPAGYTISDPLSPPPIAQEIDIHVIDLVTLSQVGMMRRAHRAYTPNEECFFIFLDASDHYLASGAEDKFGYLWERHYGISLTKLPHDDVVNAVAFNPTESDMLVSVSDDNTIKVWRSKRQCRALGIDYTKLPQGTKLYLKPRPSCCPGPSNSV
jgi:F-box/WD-40 domain protein 5